MPLGPNTLVPRRLAPYRPSIPGQRMSSGVVKHFIRSLWVEQSQRPLFQKTRWATH